MNFNIWYDILKHNDEFNVYRLLLQEGLDKEESS